MEKKKLIAHLSNWSGLTGITSFFLNNTYLRGPLLRAVNYHGTSTAFKNQLARHLEYYCCNFNLLREEDLPKFLKGEFPGERPYLLVTFDDGLKSNYTVAAKILDKFGIKGFFFIPVSFIDQSENSLEKQKEFYLKNIRDEAGRYLSPEEYQSMSWEEVKDLVCRGHAVGSHTLTHRSLGGGVDRKTLEREIVYPKKILEERLKKKIISFCWAYGEVSDYSKAAYDLVRQHYDFGFTTFAGPLRPGGDPYTIDRSNVEARMSLARVRCATGGLTELYFLTRRNYFKKLVR